MSIALGILFSVAGALVLGLLIFVLVWQIRTRHFRPNPDKAAQQEQLNQVLEPFGFAYDRESDTFYSLMDCWQREMGYCRLFDEAAPSFNMIMDCEPIPFEYGGKRWLIELWKGQYGISTGAEIGVYNTDREDVRTARFTGTYYDSASDDERLPMSFVLRRDGKAILRRKGLHWWLTGFRLGEYSPTHILTMDARITFPNRDMCRAFTASLRDIGYRPHEYSVRRNTVLVHYDTPHTTQSLNPVQEAVVQQTNENNCKLYHLVTGRYSDTLDKLEYVRTAAPELYDFFLHSLYARGLYDSFGWLIDWIHGKRPEPEPQPVPPCPAPTPPCPGPTPPCPPDPPTPPRPDPCPSPVPVAGCLLLRQVPGSPNCLLACPIPCPPDCPPHCSCDCTPGACQRPCRCNSRSCRRQNGRTRQNCPRHGCSRGKQDTSEE